MAEMRLSVWARKELHPHISEVETAKEACGIGGVVGNKGGLVVKLQVDGTTLCFVSSHLAAHEGEKKAVKRNADVAEILRNTRVGRQPWLDCSLQFDHCFWLGDLNYRVDLQQLDGVERSEVEHREEVLAIIGRKEWAVIQDADQLHRELVDDRVLAGFVEGKPDFPPTFKVRPALTASAHLPLRCLHLAGARRLHQPHPAEPQSPQSVPPPQL